MEMNYFENGEYIVSYDSLKTKIVKKNNIVTFVKKTEAKEVSSLKKISKLINNKNITINGINYTFKIPEILAWNKKSRILELEYWDGRNLEFYLRDINTHNFGKIILNEILKYLIKNKIYWIDFAPRNILISSNIIVLVDFEKGIMSKNKKISDYLRNHVYEEYCLFLLKEEREIYDDNIFNAISSKNKIYRLGKLNSKRFEAIAKNLGYDNYITKEQVLNILNMLIVVEEPYKKDNKIIYPGVILDALIANSNSIDPINEYSKEIIRLYNKKAETNSYFRLV